MQNKKRSFTTNIIFSFVLPCSVLLLFWIIEANRVGTSLIMPYPHEVFSKLFVLVKTLKFWHLLGATTLRVISSFSISLLLSILLGVCAGNYVWFNQFISFPMSVIKATPVVSFILMAIFWFSTNSVPVFIGVLMTLPVMTGGVISGIHNIDKKLDAMCSIYNVSKQQRLSSFYFPSIMPYAINGALTSFSLTWKVVVASEIIALPKISVGAALYQGKVQIETASVFAWTLAIILSSFFLENVIVWLIKLVITLNKQTALQPRAITTIQSKLADSEQRVSSLYSSTSVTIHNLSMVRSRKPLYDNFSVYFEQNTVTAFIAPSGSGKTTLFDCIAGLLKPDSGEISLIAESGHSSKTTISYLFQEPRLLPSRTILQNIELPLVNVMSVEKAQTRSLYYLEKVGLASKAFSKVSELSGGEKQRAALARAFAYPSSVFLMDEAFQSQDIRLKLQLGKLFKLLLSEEPKTVIMVTHDITEALSLSDRILVLDNSPLRIELDEQVPVQDKKSKDTTCKLWDIEQKILKILS